MSIQLFRYFGVREFGQFHRGLHEGGPPFMEAATGGEFAGVGSAKAGDMKQPAGEEVGIADLFTAPREDDEDRLCDVFGGGRVFDLPHRGGIDHINVPAHQRFERFFRMRFYESPQ